MNSNGCEAKMVACQTPGNRFQNRKVIPIRPRINTDNTQTSMRAFFLLAIMVVDIAALISSGNPFQTARRCDTMLTPSQIPTLRKHKSQTTEDSCVLPAGNSLLIPSQVDGARLRGSKTTSTQIATSSSSVHDVDPSVKKPKPKKKNPPKKGTKSNADSKGNTTLPTGGSATKTKNNNNKPKRRQRKLSSGNLPNVLWGHIPLDHIRKHPQFVPLPTPESIHALESTEDVRNFRQESWQWDVLHEGRMTTSQAVAALGFLEPRAGDILGVPRGLRRGGQGAYYRLRKPVAVTTLEEMNAMLCTGDDDDVSGSTDDEDVGKCWVQPPNYPFAAKYTVKITEDEYKKRRQIASHYAQKNWSIRMVWGNVQEATSLLTALNYFWKRDKRILMKEIGMCGAGLSFNQTSRFGTGLLLGATPDAILCHPDGRIEAVEVKNHCPFVPNKSRYNRNNDKRSKQEKDAAFRLSQQTLSNKGAFISQYIPQLMMEMLCLGENCKSAIMVRQTATSGALILRIARDDEWIEQMIYWLERFHKDFVQNETPPPENFFLESADPIDQARYKKFLDRTKQVESKVELLEHVPHRSIQRAMAKHPVSDDLFLD